MSVRWSDKTSYQLRDLAAEDPLVILPLGCTEQHGPHLPVDTDTFQVETLALRAAELALEKYGTKVLVLPTVPFGPASEHYGLAGNLSISNETYVRLIIELVRSVLDSGFRRVLVLKGCGGHWAVPAALWDAAAEAKRSGRDAVLRVLDAAGDWREIAPRHFTNPQGGHAATIETALCLAYRPELVRTEEFRAPRLERLDERYRRTGEVFLFVDMTDTGALGDPSPATAEGGRAFWDDAISAFAERLKYIEELDKDMNRIEDPSHA